MGMACETDGRLATALAAAAGPADTGAHDPAGLMHTALRHRTGAELVASLVPFVDDALRMNDQVYVSLPPYSTERLKAELGRDADRVRWTDSTRWQPHPMRRLRAIRELVEGAERHGVGRLRLVGECPLPPVPTMVTEWERFDALLNDALAGLPATVVCTYDESTLPAGVIGRAACSHPFVGLDPVDPSPDYLDPCQYWPAIASRRRSSRPTRRPWKDRWSRATPVPWSAGPSGACGGRCRRCPPRSWRTWPWR
jgi:hypothetical protein